MRKQTDQSAIQNFLEAVARAVRGPGSIYLVGGASAVWFGWRPSTIDIDIACAPEPLGLFSAIETIKRQLNINIELSAPSDFVPPLPGWQARSEFISHLGSVDFYHYDFYTQALAKLSRGHERDLHDVKHMVDGKKVEPKTLLKLVEQIRADFERYPNLDATTLVQRVKRWSSEHE